MTSPGRSPLLVRVATTWYRLLLRAYPTDFRRRYGRQMSFLFHDRCMHLRAGRRNLRIILLSITAIGEVLANAVGERLARRRERRLRPNPKPSGGTPSRPKESVSMDSIVQDLHYAIRTLRKRPAFTTVAVITLALGIGSSTAIFSVVDAVLLAPLPYENQDRLAMIWGELRARDVHNWPAAAADYGDYLNMASFEDVAAMSPTEVTLTGGEEPERVEVVFVSHNFFGVLGARPHLGRLFLPDDVDIAPPGPGDPNAERPSFSVILGYGLWQRRYGGDPEIVGSSIELAGAPVTIVGVMPPDFQAHFPATTRLPTVVDLWVASPIDLTDPQRRNVSLRVVGLLGEGVTPGQAQAEADNLAARNRRDIQLYTDVDYYIHVVPLQADLVAPVRPMVLALFAAVGLVLLIACANVASLLLVRATTRSQEISIRAALGGSRARLASQMMCEGLVLSGLASLLGLLLARAGIATLFAIRPVELPRMDSIGIDASVLGFTVLVSLGATLVFGMLPALQGSKANLVAALKTRSEVGASRRQQALRSSMVTAEVALSLVLLIGAGLMLRSSLALARIDPGYNPENLLTFQAAVPPGVYRTVEERTTFLTQLRERLASLPGVEVVGAVSGLPLSGTVSAGRYGPESAGDDVSQFRQAFYRTVLPGYFQAMETPLVAGRFFSAAEHGDSLPVVIVDELLARRAWPGESAVGHLLTIRPWGYDPIQVEVVGVVKHQRHEGLSEEGMEALYYPNRFGGSRLLMTWTLRTGVDPESLVSSVRREVQALNPDTPLINVRTMHSYTSAAQAPTRFALLLIAVFGGTALVLASVGLYGVLAYAVHQRTAEIGVRMAFGAERGTILGMVLRQGLRMTGVGIVVGLGAAFGLTRFMGSLLVGVPPTDPLTFVGIAIFFAAVAMLASYLPARRATRVDPIEALGEG